MRKEFLAYDTVRNNALKMAYRIHKDGFIPDVIYVSLRGGVYLGNVISEYFKIIQSGATRPVYYAAVVARSYTGVRESNTRVKVEGWTYSPDFLRTGDKVLLVDDIFDSGKTINHLAEIILDKGIPRPDLKVAVHDYKFFPNSEHLPVQPDYWCRKHDRSNNTEDLWIHYSSHELIGLSEEELEEHYYKEDPELREVLKIMHKGK